MAADSVQESIRLNATQSRFRREIINMAESPHKPWWKYLRASLMAIALVIPFALFQFRYVLELAWHEIDPSMLIIPVLVGTLFGFLLAKIRLLQQTSQRQLNILREKDLSLREMNHSLEEKVEIRARELTSSQTITRYILDSQINIVILTTGEELVEANQAFFQFFPEYPDLDAFRVEHQCICDFFTQPPGDDYIGTYIEGELWVTHISRYPHKTFKAHIPRRERNYTFDVKTRAMQRDGCELYVATLTDISDLMNYKNRLEALSQTLSHELFTDSLTGLPNRTCLLRDMRQDDTPGALILLDVDAFRAINDFFGQDSGDDILREISLRLRPAVSEVGATLYRLSADEFAILYPRGKKRRFLGDFTYRLHQLIESRGFMGRHDSEILVGVTLGVAKREQVEADRLLTAAALALKTAKRLRKPFMFYHEAIETRQVYARNLEEARQLRYAVRNRKVRAYFQPIYNNHTGRVEKYECLARLLDGENQIIPPARFINAAKATKLYSLLTRMVFTEILPLMRRTAYQFSLNINIDDILERETVDYIAEGVKQNGVGSQLVLEILESEGIENFEEVRHFIRQFKQLGCQIAIDDFGSGYSNFEYILKLDVDYIKLDASLIRHLDQDRHARIIVGTIQDFARQLGLRTIAEYVHSREIFEAARELDLDYSQGYFIGEPGASLLNPPHHRETHPPRRQAHPGQAQLNR